MSTLQTTQSLRITDLTGPGFLVVDINGNVSVQTLVSGLQLTPNYRIIQKGSKELWVQYSASGGVSNDWADESQLGGPH
jgi:hypothetical protein